MRSKDSVTQTTDKSYYRSLALILLFAFCLRLVWAILIPVIPLSDGNAYDVFARNLAAGQGYAWSPGHLTAHWPVGTSFVYSLLYRMFGFTYVPIVIFTSLISLATIWITATLAKRWFGTRVALITGLLLALWPAQIEFTTILGSELLFNFLLVAWILIWDSFRHRPWLCGFILGFIAAATCYVRPTGLLLPIVLMIVDIARERKIGAPVVTAATTLLLACLLIAPWSIRNTRLYGSFVHIATNGGVNLWEGNNPTGDGSTEAIPASTMDMNEALRDQYLGSIAKKYIMQYPGKFIVRSLTKAVRLYSHESIGIYWNQSGIESRFGNRAFTPLKLLSSGYWGIALILGLGGLIWLTFDRGLFQTLFHPAVAAWVYFTAVYAVIVIQDRYHFAAVPFIAMLAGYFLYRLCAAISAPVAGRHVSTEEAEQTSGFEPDRVPATSA